MLRLLTACAAAAIAFLVGFSAMGVHDTQAMSGAKSALVITRVDDPVRALAILRSEADALRANFYRVRIDPSGRSPSRTLAAIVGNRAGHDIVFPGGEYAAFDRAMTTELVPLRGELVGTFFVTRSPGDLQAVAHRLEGAGAEVRVESLNWTGLALYMLAYTPIVLAGAVVLCAAWFCGFASGFARIREHAARALLGARCSLVHDAGWVVLLAGLTFAAMTAIAATILHGYNDGDQFAAYVGVSLVLFGAVVIAFLAGFGNAALLTRRSRYRAAFSGWRPWSRGAFTRGAVQVLTLTLVIFLAAEAGSAASSFATLQRSGPAWGGCAQCTTTIFNGFGGPTALDDAVRPFAAAVRGQDARGGIVMGWARGSTRGDVFTPASSAANVIIANEGFIARSGGRLPNPIGDDHGPGEWGLLVPSTHIAESDAIAAEWRESLAHPLGSVAEHAEPKPPHIATYRAGPVFNYGQTDFRDDVYSQSPVVVILPAGSGLVDDESYFAAGSAGDLLFTGGAAHTRKLLDEAGVSPSVYVLDSLDTQIQRGLSAARTKLSIAIVGILAGVVALSGMLFVSARAGIARRRDELFQRRLLGCAPVRRLSSTIGRSVVAIGAASALLPVVATSGFVDGRLTTGQVASAALAVFAVSIMTELCIAARLSTYQGLRNDG